MRVHGLVIDCSGRQRGRCEVRYGVDSEVVFVFQRDCIAGSMVRVSSGSAGSTRRRGEQKALSLDLSVAVVTARVRGVRRGQRALESWCRCCHEN